MVTTYFQSLTHDKLIKQVLISVSRVVQLYKQQQQLYASRASEVTGEYVKSWHKPHGVIHTCCTSGGCFITVC